MIETFMQLMPDFADRIDETGVGLLLPNARILRHENGDEAEVLRRLDGTGTLFRVTFEKVS